MRSSPISTPSESASVDQVQAAAEITVKLLSQWPDYDKATKPYVLGITEFIATLNETELYDLLHPRTGIRTKCKFLPTTADMAKLIDKVGGERKTAEAEAHMKELAEQERLKAILDTAARERRHDELMQSRQGRLREIQRTIPDATLLSDGCIVRWTKNVYRDGGWHDDPVGPGDPAHRFQMLDEWRN